MRFLRDNSTRTALAAGALVLAGVAAYHNSFSGRFIFDDTDAILENPTLRHLWPPWAAFLPPSGGLTVSGRPIVNFSLAVNYALGGLNPWGYHAVNLLIHVLGGLTLFGAVRRTLKEGWGLALAVALIWVVHPLQTESVTYIVQRAESLMGLFYLLTLYCFIRAVEVRPAVAGLGGGIRSREAASTDAGLRRRGPALQDRVISPICHATAWRFLTVLFCLLGMGTKEVMVSAPVVVFLYDRTFVSGSFREAGRRHKGLLVALAACWIPLLALVLSTHGRGGTAGASSGIGWARYLPTQFPAVVRYLRLAFWPSSQVFDYGADWTQPAVEILGCAAAVGLLAVGSAVAFFWRSSPSSGRVLGARAAGFCGIWFFAVLAPTSLVPGGRQTLAEHRMYLALAPVVAVVVSGVACLGRRAAGKSWGAPWKVVALAALVLALIAATVRRNEVYRSDLALWRDTAAKRPGNAFAFTNLGVAEFAAGRTIEASALFAKAIRLNPAEFDAEYNLGIALAAAGRRAEAISHYERALVLEPTLYKARNNLGVLLTDAGRYPEAVAELREAVRIKPDFVAGRIDLGIALADSGLLAEAAAQYQAALRTDPDSAEVHGNLGNALKRQGRGAEAMAEYRTALRLKPDYADAHNNLGVAYSDIGRREEAVAQFREALRLKPDFVDAHENLGTALAQSGRLDRAEAEFAAAVRLDPDNASARNALGGVLSQLGRGAEAIPQYQAALRLDPGFAQARANLGVALAGAGRMEEAMRELSRAVQLAPNYAEAQCNLAVVLAATGRLPEALQHYRIALRLAPGNPDIRANYEAALKSGGAAP